MNEISKTVHTESNVVELVNWIIKKAIEGVPPLCSAENLAKEYLIDESFSNNEERIDSLINWQMARNFTTGFITGFGGLLTLPISIPAALGASWVLQARMAGAIARICKHDLKEDRVQTLVLTSLLGNAGKEVIKTAGMKIASRSTAIAIQKIPGKIIIEINKKVGFRLLTKAGQRGVINLMKIVPVAGGIVGGCIDATACRAVGYAAKELFLNRKSL